MIKFKIETKMAIHFFTSCNNKSALFDLIERKAGIEEAIEATSWAELASIGETYEHELFTITIIEE